MAANHRARNTTILSQLDPALGIATPDSPGIRIRARVMTFKDRSGVKCGEKTTRENAQSHPDVETFDVEVTAAAEARRSRRVTVLPIESLCATT